MLVARIKKTKVGMPVGAMEALLDLLAVGSQYTGPSTPCAGLLTLDEADE
jgi:hypothetical protein